jgi:hypothetical protein
LVSKDDDSFDEKFGRVIWAIALGAAGLGTLLLTGAALLGFVALWKWVF